MSWRESKFIAFFGALIWIAFGWLGAVAWFEVLRPYAQSVSSITCVEHDACVGQATDKFLLAYDDDRGGLTGIICGDAWIFLGDIVEGKTCSTKSYVLEFRNPSARTIVTVENGVVSEISIGLLHNIDL